MSGGTRIGKGREGLLERYAAGGNVKGGVMVVS